MMPDDDLDELAAHLRDAEDVNVARSLNIETLTLASGGHDESAGEMCVMEAVAYVAGERWSDAPQCASPVTAAFCRVWNDTPDPFGEAIRYQLKRYILRLVGSRGTSEQDERRAWLATDWLMRVHAPAWLRLAGLTEHAEALAALPPQTSAEAVQASAAARDAASAAASAAAWAAAWDAASAAARAAAWDAAWDAASAAASAAARDAASAAASAAAWDAAWDAASAAARAAASAAASAAARAAAWAAASAAAWAAASAAAWDAASAAAWDAASEKLAPTVAELQASAWELLDALLAVTESSERERSGGDGA